MRWPADENFNHDIVRAVSRARPGIDLIRAQDAGLTGCSDEALLKWAADHDRVLLTHDVTTLSAHAYRRIVEGMPMSGVFEIGPRVQIRTAIEDIILLEECSAPGEWEGQIRYLPLR